MDRRDFLKKGALAAVGAVAGGSVLSGLLGLGGCSEKTRPDKRVGLQLYSLREAMGQDPEGTLKIIAGMGYKELETASYRDGKLYGYSPAEFRAIVEDLGMSVSSAHLGHPYDAENEQEVMDWWDLALDTQVAAGCRYAIMPSFPIGDTLDDIKLYADYWNRVGEMANGKGIRFGFHNHNREFEQRDGHVIMDYLIENTDPDKVFYELDVYWAQVGGTDPVAYIEKWGSRIPVLHIKDESIIGESGNLDFKAIFDAAYAQGMKDYYVEVEKYTLPPENCVQKSFDYLYNADFVK
ncbi:MAG: sugar phosphate isomerase/epimerase [Alistipes sp.]|nr:sugar phosphate isomerase/epimerase [Alistipes sp.]